MSSLKNNAATTKEGVSKSAYRRLQKLNRLWESLITPASLEERLKTIASGIVDIFDASFCRIWTVRPADRCDDCPHSGGKSFRHQCVYQNQCLHLLASSGDYTHTDGKMHRRVPLGCYKIGRIAAGEANKLISNNVRTDKQIHNNKWAKEMGLVSFAGYRLLSSQGDVKGVLALFARHTITPEDDLILEGIANTTAQIICSEQTNTALQESEARFRTLFEQAGIGMVIVDLTNTMRGEKKVQYNRMAQDFLGYSEAELQKKNVQDISHPDDLDKDLTLFKELLAGKRKSYETEKRYVRKDGQVVWARLNVSLLYDSQGRRKYSLATLVDITQRKQAEEDLKLFHDLIDQSNDSIFVIDPLSGKFLNVNHRACQSLGYNCKELLALGIQDVETDNPKLQCWEKYIDEVRKTGNMIVEGVHKRKNGSRFSVEMSMKYIVHSKKHYLLAVGRDVTKRKRMEKKMTNLLAKVIKAKQEWEMTFDTTIELVAIVNKHHKIIRCNKSFANFVGKSTKELLGQYCYDYLHCDNLTVTECRAQMPIEKTVAINNQQTKQHHWFYLNCRPITDAKGKFLYTVIACTDISDLKKTTDRLIESKKELKTRVDELEKFYEMAIGRELKMKELKAEIKKLRNKLSLYKDK